MNPNSNTDLDWLAFRYIADELPATEREAFELRLADDQLACEALARAVELADTIQAAESLSPVATSPPAASWKVRLSWLAAGATAAAVLFGVIVAGPSWLGSGSSGGISTELAVAWSKALPVVPQATTQLPAEAVPDVAMADVPESETAAEDAPPSWMVAAVRGLAEAKKPGDPDADMNLEATEPFSKEPVGN
jgi:hypothetical protein